MENNIEKIPNTTLNSIKLSESFSSVYKNNSLSEDDLKKVDEIYNTINLKDSVSIMSYGAIAQNKMMQFSDNTLNNVINKDLGEVGNIITNVVNELKGFNIENEKNRKGFLVFLKKLIIV